MSEASAPDDRGVFRRFAPEIVLILLAATAFLGRLGAMELWGKREQRAVAEALDTIEQKHWLVAQIQSRPRLEKPPLPRWTIASLMAATGLRDESLMRLPNALSALAMVGLVYGLGRRMGGRPAGIAAGLILASTFFFVVESRQAGNDGPLAFFATLALYAAFRRLHGVPADDPPGLPADRLGSKWWASLCWVAMGLGFLSKGPVVLILVALAVVPYLVVARRFKAGSKALMNAPGMIAFLVLALTWPVPVLMYHPKAARIWWLEMGQKAGAAGIAHHTQRSFARQWPWMTAPWTMLATWGVLVPFLQRGREKTPTVWFAWSWAVVNFAMFCLWSVAKPNYYVPCEPGVALLSGLAWVGVMNAARDPLSRSSGRAQRFVQFHWAAFALLAIAGPIMIVAAWRSMPFMRNYLTPEVAATVIMPVTCAGLALASGVIASVWAWRRRVDSAVLPSMVGGMTIALAIGYAAIIPEFNAGRSHRTLAAELDRALPADVSTVMFYKELDEGLWYYLKNRTLAPVPGSTPEYSKAADFKFQSDEGTVIWDDKVRTAAERKVLIDWLDGPEHQSPYLLIRAKVFDLFSPGIAERAEPIFRETGVDRNNKLMLLKLRPKPEVAGGAGAERR